MGIGAAALVVVIWVLSRGSGLVLPEAERKYIAVIEHRNLLLGKKGFKAVAKKIMARDTEGLARLLSGSFVGEVRDFGPDEALMSGTIHWRSVRAGSAARKVNGKQMARFLVKIHRGFHKKTKVKIKGRGLGPVRREELDGAWRGRAKIMFRGRDPVGNPRKVLLELALDYASIPPLDRMARAHGGIAGIQVLHGYETTTAAPLMADVAAARGLEVHKLYDNWKARGGPGREFLSGSVIVEDFDGDGYPDLLVPDRHAVFLYRNTGDGHFEDLTAPGMFTGGVNPNNNGVAGDFDGDGRVDVIFASTCYRNMGDLHFESVPCKGIKFVESAGATVADFDRDGRLDVYATQLGEGKQDSSYFDGPATTGHSLFRNLGGWRFEDVAPKLGATCGKRSSDTAGWLYANDDLQPDLYVVNEFGPGVLLLSKPDGSYREHVHKNSALQGTMGLALGDYNNDGRVDIYTASMFSKAGNRIMDNLSPDLYPRGVLAKMKRFVAGSDLFHNEGNLKLTAVGARMRVHDVGWAHGSTFVDLDNDGYLDIYSTTGYISISRKLPDG